MLLMQEEHISSHSSHHFVFAHDKNRKRAEVWVKINLYNVFVMYALGLAHVKIDI